MTNPYATVLFLVFSVQVGSYAIGWGSEETPFPGFDGTMYEQTFSRADRARDPERWMLDANDGVQAAIANWERSAALYYSGTASIEGARSTLLAWTEEDMARRFSVWLRDLFFGREGISLSAMVADASAQANRRLLYQTNADGERIYDETGNPVYRTRVEGVSIAGDTASWSLEVSGATSRAVSILGARLEAIRNRLVSLVPLRQRDSFLDLIARSESEATNTITLELDALAKREERLFVARRSSDIFSLRQRSEKETASVMAAEIVRSTSLACEQSLEALNVRIEAARRDNSELNIAGADWLSDFKIQFDRGLSSWKAAEERFMVRRLEWERDAARAFYEGNEAWALAYAGLEKEQRAWESKASLLLQKGEDTFAKASLDLEDDIRQAKIEFQRDALQRTSASADRASAWVDVYLQASAAATGFKEAASYWLALLGPESPLPDSETLESWLAERENAPGTDDKQAGYIAQVRDCMASYASYVTNAMDARENVLHDFDLVMGFEAGALQDVLAGDASSEDFNLDEFQVALLRAKAIEGYWTRRVSIAKAVLDYANDLSSERVTEAEHIQRLRDAQEAYDEGLETYGQARASLSESATDIAEGRLSMNTAVANLETAGEALESVNAEYSMLLAALASGGDGGFIGQDIFERYRDLLRIDGITSADAIVNEQAGSVAFLLARYIESARALGHAQDIERAGEALRLAVNGSAMEPSLKALAATHGAINVPSDIWAVPLDIDAYGIQNGDPSYSLLEGLMAEMTGCLAAAVTHDDVATIRKAYGGIIIRVAEGARTRAATALTTRLAGIALLGSRSAKEWYEGQRGEELQTEGCMDALLHDAMMAGRNLLLARVELELQAIGILLGTIAPEEAPGAGLDLALNPFSSVAKMDAESAVEARGSLEALHELILATMDADEPAFNSSLEALARDDEAIAMFARGRGFFTLAGADLGSLFLPVESSEIDGTIGLLHAYDRYGPSAIGLEEQRLNACYTSLLSSFASLGLGIEDGNCLPSTRELGQRLLEPGVDAVHAMIEITRAVEQSRTSSPPWVSAELYAWRDSIVDYVARRTIVYGSLSPEPSFALQQVLDANDTQCATLARILHGLSGTGDTMIQALCQAGSELAWSSSESSTLRHETARLMSQALIVDAAWLNETPDWQALENSITASAESRFSYADDVLRNMAVSLAMDTLRIDDALGMERDPSLLSGAALKTRLESIWMNIEPQSIAEAASVAVNTIARTAYAMRSLVFDALSMDGLDVDRDDIASLLEPGHDGEVSWLDTYYQSEGEEAGSVMAFLLVQALGSESDPWSLEIAKNRVDSLALDSIDGALSCRDRLRDGTGLASIPAERLLAMRIAMLSPDNDYLAWVLEAMGLRGREGVQSLVSEPSNDPVAEAFLDLGDYQYAFEAASFFLASQALDGILPASVYENRYPLGSSLRAERLQHILEQTGDFAGTYSGDTLGWAMRRSAGDDDLALALVRYLEFGTLDDDIADLCGFGLHGSRPGDAFVRWVVGNVSMLAESKVQDSKGISVAIEFSRAYETALAKSSEGAAHGALHWRQYLLSDAIAIANSEAGASSCLPLPGTPGDPETEPCGVPCSARSWSEGALIDSFEEAHRCCSVFNQTMEAWKASIADRNDRGDGARLASAAYRAFEPFSALVSQYGSSPETAFDPDSVTLVPVGLCLEHQKADGDYRASGYSRIAAHDAIARLAKAYSLVSDVGAIEQRLLSIQEEIVLARDANTDAMRLFAEASEAFSLAGASYETAYVLYMELYENLEATRLFLEKERAIERWASSAYLYAGEETDSADLACSYKSPQEESSCAEECLSRAQKSLEMLKRLYGDDVSGRPYDSPEHDAARELYRLNLERVMLSAKARDALSTALSSEYRCNEAAYTEYRKSVFGDSCGAYKMVARPLDFSEYTIPVSNEDASWKDFLRLGSDGRLALALDGGYRLIAVDGAVAKRLEEYFNTPSKPVDAVDEHESTAYERDVRTWSSRVQTYMAKASSFNDWAMARDYLVGRIISANPEFTVLQGSITHASHLSNTVGSQHIQGSCLADQIETYSKDAMLVSQLNAFNRMSAQERADLEFYVILSLTGGARLSSSAFGKASELAEYEFVYKAINTEIATKQSNAKNLNIAGATFWGLGMLFSWTPIGPVYLCSAGVMFGMAIIENTCAQTLTRLNASYVVPELMVTRATLSSGRSMLSSELAGINHSYAEYKQSCGRLAVLKGTNPGVDPSVAMKSALQQLECLDADEVMALLDMFDVCKADGAGVYTSTAEALTSLSRWSAANRDSAFQNTERVYARDEATRLENERRYREENERFISFGTGEASVAQAAFAAYGPQAASCKKHLYDVADSTRKLVLSEEPGMVSKESTDAARLYVRLIDRAVNARYAAEMTARELAWDIARKDLYDKQMAWREAGSLIVSRGRDDFDDGLALIRQRLDAWQKQFGSELETRRTTWNLHHASMQEQKLDWVARATSAADEAATAAMLALVGIDADEAVRHVDSMLVTRMDFQTGADAAYDEAMNQAGIAGMSAALLCLSSPALDPVLRRGMAGIGSWNTGQIMVAAAGFAQKAQSNLAGVQARLMAANAREAANVALVSLDDSLRMANESIDESMNETFVSGGKWKREGSSYIKDVVVHSTVSEPFITEHASVDAFAFYVMSPWTMKTDLSDATLSAMDHTGIRALIEKAQHELRLKSDELFGSDEDNSVDAIAARTAIVRVTRKEKQKVETRTVEWINDEGLPESRDVDVYDMVDVFDHEVRQILGAGRFGGHVGYSPVARVGVDPDESETTIFQAPGKGELGRMMATYIYFSMKEGKGWSAAAMPLYEKHLWDDRGAIVQAPSIRILADLGLTIAAGALSGGLGAVAMNLVDDVLFGAMDMAGGYKAWEEAGLDFGKKAVGSFLGYSNTQFYGKALSSLSGMNTLNRVVGKTMLSGMSGIGNTMSAGVLSSVRLGYTDDGLVSGLSFDTDALKTSMFSESSLASILGGMAGAAFDTSCSGSSAYSNKVFGGLKSLGSMAITEGTRYATHLGFSSARGLGGQEMMHDAWVHDGGITLDVANVGSILETIGVLGGVLGDGYSPMDRELYTVMSRSLGAASVSLTLGSDGPTLSLGGGGYNLLDMALSTGKGLFIDKSLSAYTKGKGAWLEESLKAAYGYGDTAMEETLMRITLGKDTLMFAGGDGKAMTSLGPDMNRMIRLSVPGDRIEDRLDVAVSLQHEAWRDGRAGSAEGQSMETRAAARAHSAMAMRLLGSDEYGYDALSLFAGNNTYRNDLFHAYRGDFNAYVDEAYDSSDDLWRLTRNGTLLNDGRARLLQEILNDDGSKGWRLIEGSEAEESTAGALVHYLGADRAMALLGGSMYDMSHYDDATLQDVLNLDEVDLRIVRNNPAEAERIIAGASAEQRNRLLGEAIMKQGGISWNAQAGSWLGEGVGLALSELPLHGDASIRSIGPGIYSRYSITSEIERMEGAYAVWMNGQKGDIGAGNTRVSFTKWDIDTGEQLATIVGGGAWNSVDNSYGQLDSHGNPIGADQPYQLLFGPLLQGNTLGQGSLDLRLALANHINYTDPFIISNSTNIAGESIGVQGTRVGYPQDLRWLMHSTITGSSDGCIVYQKIPDATNHYDELVKQLRSWGMYTGYNIEGTLFDASKYPYQAGCKKGSW